MIALMLAALNSCSHNFSVIAATLRVDTRCAYVCAKAATSAFSRRA